MSPVLSLRRLLPIGPFLLLCLSLASPGRAQVPEVGKLRNGGIDLQVFHPGVDSKGFITLNASQILGPKEFSFGLVSTWARDPLTFEATVGGNTQSTWELQNLITSSFQGAVGVFARRQLGLQIGLVLPVSILSGQAQPSDPRMPGTNDDRNYKFDAQGLGDLVIHPKFRLSNASRNKLGLLDHPQPGHPERGQRQLLRRGQVHLPADRGGRHRAGTAGLVPGGAERGSAHPHRRNLPVHRNRAELLAPRERHAHEHQPGHPGRQRVAGRPGRLGRGVAGQVRRRGRALLLERTGQQQDPAHATSR